MNLRHVIVACCGALAVVSCGAPDLPAPTGATAVGTTSVGTPTPSATPSDTYRAPNEPPGVSATGAPKTITGCDYPYPRSTTYFSDGSTGWTPFCEEQMRQRVQDEGQLGGFDCQGGACTGPQEEPAEGGPSAEPPAAEPPATFEPAQPTDSTSAGVPDVADVGSRLGLELG